METCWGFQYEEDMETGENSPEVMDDDDVQEVKEDSDSDIMEVDQEDPLLKKNSSVVAKAHETSKTSTITSIEVKKPQVCSRFIWIFILIMG